jgi:hypothetical protein
LRQTIRETLDEQERSTRLMQKRLTTELQRLDKQEENLLDLAADGGLAADKIKVRLGAIQRQRDKLRRQVTDGGEQLAIGAELLENALLLLANPQELYGRMSPEQRRLLNQAIFEKLYVSEDERVAITGAQFNVPFGDLIDTRDELRLIRHRRQACRASSSSETLAEAVGEVQSPLTSLFVGHGSKRPVMVGARGLEPPTSAV